ncbi:phage minor capsid protein [Enterocloster clostridioformis]|uniref:Phage minor capsid protein 2 n=1 Tax=Enterocloster clostridioformis TaxID=1531 RepID=A0A1I0KBN0_9FIRM|nr:phage minor capsid protein [Enterocloster clostridioformis]SEU21425.1 Phage minor capsid protein 2 [Enterocloster clostridioformis]SEW49451.1 Phage minor capsid protein 2 [Enterocloster clostridioformis]
MTPEELEKLPKPLERTMTALELSIMDEIIQRIKEAAQITPVIDWLLVRMDAIGKSRTNIKRMIGDAIVKAGLQVDDIYEQAAKSDYIRNKEIYEAAGRDYLPYEDNQWLQHVVDAARRQTKGSLRSMENITQTTGFNVPMGGGKKVFTPLSEYLERSLDKAMLGITTGTRTYSQAIGEVIDEMTASGIRTVDYASGKSDRIEVAARRAVMTGVAQMTKQVSDKNAEELGTDHWEVDWHMGARNTGTGYLNHQSWQGKVYSTAEMHTICGEGEMLGFAGINCYHIKFPFLPGVSKRKYTDEWLEEQNRHENEKMMFNGKEYDTYGALQHQRKLERTIRKRKQDVELLERAGADKEDVIAARCRLRLTNKTYVDFSKEMGLRQQQERLKIPRDKRLLDANRLKVPDEIMKIKGMTADGRIRIEKTITMMQKKYDIQIGEVSVESMGKLEKGTYFMAGPYMERGRLKIGLVINRDIDYTGIDKKISEGYGSGYLAARNLEDSIKHELAHVMTFQGCNTYEEYQVLMEKIPFIPGISGYADKCKDGTESLAEAFVRMQNGEKIPLKARMLVNKYIESWKR